MCGGTATGRRWFPTSPGLSPRVRGNPAISIRCHTASRSIPACAGEPVGLGTEVPARGVYPRVCGGTSEPRPRFPMHSGLSPRVRGNPIRLYPVGKSAGSIPACAGEPSRRAYLPRYQRVYPRVCGGTPVHTLRATRPYGLSPRVRGNHGDAIIAERLGGSIPACAGEPTLAAYLGCPTAVYPRVCGGTVKVNRRLLPGQGLSPRVRGNLIQASRTSITRRSIPACAGEPPAISLTTGIIKVYPRVCGGTRPTGIALPPPRGLSPRVRGNPYRGCRGVRYRGSIPACAGEPRLAGKTLRPRRVYPRVCGGTWGCTSGYARGRGLSPRVRGNPWFTMRRACFLGSIPACAGEPAHRRLGPDLHSVYPRVCGGTRQAFAGMGRSHGLSPRVRGNLIAPMLPLSPTRSIPACAGEPDTA